MSVLQGCSAFMMSQNRDYKMFAMR